PERESVRDDQEVLELSIFDLIAAFQKVLSTMKKEDIMEIEGERFSLTDTISEILERLQSAKDMTFNELLGEGFTRRRLVYNFLAILELMKLKMIRARQAAPFGVIRIFLAVEE
ncbi:MAG: segregation/condensation protein A, partial [Syntrophaceae bacterium]